VRRQLIQEYVQKSTRITLPFSSSRFNGRELSHATAPERSGSVCGPAVWPAVVEDIIIMPGFFGCKRSMSDCSTPDVLAIESCVNKPRSRQSAIAATPAKTAAPKMLRIQTSARKERLRAANTLPPANTATANDVAAPAA
jgi:hypothetical protein